MAAYIFSTSSFAFSFQPLGFSYHKCGLPGSCWFFFFNSQIKRMIDMQNMFHNFVCCLVFYFQTFVQISVLLPPFFFLFNPSSSFLFCPSLYIFSYSSSAFSSFYSSLSYSFFPSFFSCSFTFSFSSFSFSLQSSSSFWKCYELPCSLLDLQNSFHILNPHLLSNLSLLICGLSICFLKDLFCRVQVFHY